MQMKKEAYNVDIVSPSIANGKIYKQCMKIILNAINAEKNKIEVKFCVIKICPVCKKEYPLCE